MFTISAIHYLVYNTCQFYDTQGTWTLVSLIPGPELLPNSSTLFPTNHSVYSPTFLSSRLSFGVVYDTSEKRISQDLL